MPSEIMMEFIEDSTEHLVAAGQHLLALEKDIDQPDELNGLLRRIHSVKGNAGFLNLRHLYDLLHKAENILQGIREEKPSAWPAALIDIQLQVLDTVETMVSNLSADGNDHVDWLDEIMDALDRLEKEIDSPEAQRPVKTKPPPGASEKLEKVPSIPVPDESERAGTIPEILRDRVSVREKLRRRFSTLQETAEIEKSGSAPISAVKLMNQLESIQSEFAGVLEPNTSRALNLINEYLAGLPDLNKLDESALTHLTGLIENFLAWLETEKQEDDSRIEVIRVTSQSLQSEGRWLRSQVDANLALNPPGLIFDLRAFQTMSSREIGILLSHMKRADESTRVGMILDPDKQSGVRQVFKVMGLEKAFQIFAHQSEVLDAWGGLDA